MSGSADVILIPEIPFDIEKVCEKIMAREAAGRHFSIVVCAEGALPVGGELTIVETAHRRPEARLGGIAEKVAREIEKRTGKETRSMVLGHLQRGGTPTVVRPPALAALRRGRGAPGRGRPLGHDGRLRPAGDDGGAAGGGGGHAEDACPSECDTVRTARELGISFGD